MAALLDKKVGLISENGRESIERSLAEGRHVDKANITDEVGLAPANETCTNIGWLLSAQASPACSLFMPSRVVRSRSR